MNKNLARKADSLLKIISKYKNQAWSISRIEEESITLSISIDDANIFISMFMEDDIFEKFKHPSNPEHDYGLYMLSHKGYKFIHVDGGYTEKQKNDSYNKTNVKFTWIRHWVWFYTSIISLLANVYFILKYLAK